MVLKTDPNNEFFTSERCAIVEILNTDAYQNLSIARARVKPGITTALHQVSVEEFYYILEGIGFVEIDGSFTQQVTIGDLVHIKAGKTQRITNIDTCDLVFLCICLPRFTNEAYSSLE